MLLWPVGTMYVCIINIAVTRIRKHNFVAAILNFGSHIEFIYVYTFYFLKLDIQIYYFANFKYNFIVYTAVTAISIKPWIMAAILDFGGHVWFKKPELNLYQSSVQNQPNFVKSAIIKNK